MSFEAPKGWQPEKPSLDKMAPVAVGDIVRVREGAEGTKEWRKQFGPAGKVTDVMDTPEASQGQIVWVQPLKVVEAEGKVVALVQAADAVSGVFSREQVRPLQRMVDGEWVSFK